jgi:predicted RNase H-like nuclease (RuvC/YqgF family)
LIEETEAIIKQEKKMRDVKVKQEVQEVQDVDPVKQLKQEAQTLKEANMILEQQLKDRDHIIGLLKQENKSLEDHQASNKTIALLESLVQSKTNEIEFLKEKSTHLENENHDLKQLLPDTRHLSRHGYPSGSKKRKVEY